MGGLSSIRPEIQDFVSRENRSHADPWLQQVEWVENDRTLTLFVRRPSALARPEKEKAAVREQVLATLARPSLLKIYFPASLDEKPFCFCEEDVLVPATESANDRLRPLSCNSVLAVVTTALQCVKKEFPTFALGSSPGGASRAQLAAEAVLYAVKEDPLGADLGLALLSMAVSSYRRETVSTPFPRQLESAGLKRDYLAFVTCLEGLPTMREISSWTDTGQLLRLPPVAVLALHFVLVDLPAGIRTPASSSAHPVSPPACGGGHGSPSAVAGGEGRTGPGPAETASPAASSGKGRGGGGERAGSLRAGTAGGVGVGRVGGSAGDGGGGDGGVVTQLGGVPSYVFDVVLPSDPAFDAEVARGDSRVAYHGSSPENFHSILNTGLRVMSGSRLMKHGAAFGEGIYLSGSCKAATTFACRGDGSGTTVWPRSVFGSSPPPAGGGGGTLSSKFRYRLVAKCRVLKGDGVKEIEGSEDEASYFVVSDQSRVRVEELLLFHETLTSESFTTAAAAAAGASPPGGTAARALVSGSSVKGKGKGGGARADRKAGEDAKGNGDGGEGVGMARRSRSWLGRVAKFCWMWVVYAVLSALRFLAWCLFAVFVLFAFGLFDAASKRA